MPLPKRVIEPVHVTRGTLPEDFPLPSELEAVTNGTLANTVRQLSSLSKHAEDLFGELARDAQQLYDRTNSLQARIDRLAVKVTQLDSTVEEVSLQDIQMKKTFKSSMVFDQQIFSRSTMPTAMLETYNSCDKPPPLDKLNCYRDDGKDGVKFYTDPNYFFELWRQEMLIDTERMMHDRNKKPHRPRAAESGQGNRQKKRVRQPHNTRERQKQIAMGHGEYIMPQNQIYRSPQSMVQMSVPQHEDAIPDRPLRPNSIEIRRSYQQEVPDGLHSPTYPRYEENPYQQTMYNQNPLSQESLYQQSGLGTPTRKIRPTQPPPAPPSNQSTPSANTPTRSTRSIPRDTLPPPPPPPEATMSPPNGIPPHLSRQTSQSRSNSPHSHQGTPESGQDLPPPPPIPKQASPPKAQTPVQASPPPPPPPMPLGIVTNGAINLPMVNGDLAKIMSQTPPKLAPVKDRQIKQLPQMDNPRNDLLKAIRDGIKLRKVEKTEQKEVERLDVASILRRRFALEFSDSDSGSDSECDSEGWGDNETSA